MFLQFGEGYLFCKCRYINSLMADGKLGHKQNDFTLWPTSRHKIKLSGFLYTFLSHGNEGRIAYISSFMHKILRKI